MSNMYAVRLLFKSLTTGDRNFVSEDRRRVCDAAIASVPSELRKAAAQTLRGFVEGSVNECGGWAGDYSVHILAHIVEGV